MKIKKKNFVVVSFYSQVIYKLSSLYHNRLHDCGREMVKVIIYYYRSLFMKFALCIPLRLNNFTLSQQKKMDNDFKDTFSKELKDLTDNILNMIQVFVQVSTFKEELCTITNLDGIKQ